MADNENPSTPTPPKRCIIPSAEFADIINGNLIKLKSIKPGLLNAQEIGELVMVTFITVARQITALTEAVEELKKAQSDGHSDSDRDPAG